MLRHSYVMYFSFLLIKILLPRFQVFDANNTSLSIMNNQIAKFYNGLKMGIRKSHQQKKTNLTIKNNQTVAVVY